ncbi:MAG: hypothetical protein ACYTF9_11995, partial [Planctomycetota bacterium]
MRSESTRPNKWRASAGLTCGCLVASFAFCASASAQYVSGHEADTVTGSPEGTVVTGQDGFYNPVDVSWDGLVYTYDGNALGLPQNPNGGAQFVGVTGNNVLVPPVTQPF